MILDKITVNKVVNCKIEDISDEIYFSNAYSDWVSNSKLSLIDPTEGGSAQKFKAGLGENKIFSSALELGSAIHEVILQPDIFYICDKVDKPTGKLCFMSDYILKNELNLDKEGITAAAIEFDYYKGNLSEKQFENVIEKCKDYIEYMRSEDSIYDKEAMAPIYLSSYDRYRALECIKSVQQNNTMQNLLIPKCIYEDPFILNEGTILMEVEFKVPFEDDFKLVTLKLKGKLDNYTINPEDKVLTLNDLKSTGKDIDLFGESFKRFHYARQMGLYLWMLKSFYGESLSNEYKLEANMLVVQTNKPFTSRVFPVSLESVQSGLAEASNLLKRVAFHEVYGYEKDVEEFER